MAAHCATFPGPASHYEAEIPPIGKGRAWLAESPLRLLLGGWGVGGILTMPSGPLFTVTTQVNSVYSATGARRANVSGNPNLPASQRTLSLWFDTTVFSQPATATFGNQGVNLLRSDATVNMDVSIQRNFVLPGEGRKIQFRGELFNIANHPNFGVPGRVLGGPGFGIVGSAGPARTVQLGLKLTY